MDGDAELARESEDLTLGPPKLRGKDRGEQPLKEYEAKLYIVVKAANEDEAREMIDTFVAAHDGAQLTLATNGDYPVEC